MAKFRKKPVVVEAMRLDGSEAGARAVLEWADPHTPGRTLAARHRETGEWIVVIETLEGVMSADPGDYIIRGVQGEFYPCKPDIFAETYELIE